MRVLIAYYSKTGSTRAIAERLASVFLQKGHVVELHTVKPKKELKAYQHKGTNIELEQPLLDVRDYDLIAVGTPVWDFCPCPIITTYLRKLRHAKGRRFALFASCIGLPGTTIKRMSNILATKGAVIISSLTLRSIFDLDENKLKEAEKFAESLLAPVPDVAE